jgi:predicted alpha/beta superfamily hydrolase
MTKISLILLLATLILISSTKAQDTVLTVNNNSRLDSLNSQILKQKRYVQVFLPANYTPGSPEKYDVLYVLDGGNWNTGLIFRIQRFVENEGNMPPTIIVSVMGIDRNVELTPTHLDSWKGSGGAEKFLGFITSELIPHIDSTCPTNGDNTLWGHSLSGMFAVYAMLNQPTVFKSYIAADPSIWWDKNLVARMAAEKLPTMPELHATLYISGREGQLQDMKIDTLETVLKHFAPPGLRWKIVPYKEETHSSVRFKTTYDGLKYTYAGMVSDLQFAPDSGIVLKDSPIKIWYFDDTTRLHYTLDGSTPTEASPAVAPEITLKGPAKVSFRRFTNRSRYDKSVTGEFVLGTPTPTVNLPGTSRPGGFSYAYYEGDWDTWPDLGKLQPVKTGIAGKGFDIDNLPRKINYALLIDGFIQIKEDGYHLFVLNADKNSKLYLGGKLMMNWNGGYNHMINSYILPLKKGFYPFRMEYLHKKQDFRLQINYLTPGRIKTKDPQPIPLDLQYSAQ